MNKILQLFDEDFVMDYFRREVLPLYPDFSQVISVKIKPYKKMVWKTTYHVVVGFNVEVFSDKKNKNENIFLVCSAHSEEPRENVFKVLTFLWRKGLAADWIDIPFPLFYSQEFKGVFYSGLRGENILKQVREGGPTALEKMILAGKLFANLHSLTVNDSLEFNLQNAKIETVVPGVEAIFKGMTNRYGDVYDKEIRYFYNYFIKEEEKYLQQEKNLCLIHGDAHLENIIDTGPGRLGVIDFADFCIGDFARDLGTFLQQLEHRLLKKEDGSRDLEQEKLLKEAFLHSYIIERGLVLDDNLKARIKLYYDWTMLRTATYFFLKSESEVERAVNLFKKVDRSLKSEEFII